MKRSLAAIVILLGTVGRLQAECKKNITLFIVSAGRVQEAGPAFAYKWIEKNQKKYKDLCFNEYAKPGLDSYALVFSEGQTSSQGFQPTVKTSTSTSTTPVNGSGTITSNSGATWQYTYNGTVTTTTTTQTLGSAQYVDTSNTLYITIYSSTGTMLSQRWRTFTSRQGGDGANTFGYNLGSALFAIHAREHLLKASLEDLEK